MRGGDRIGTVPQDPFILPATNVQQAILIELFALVIVVFGGFYWLVESGNRFQLVVNLGLIVGVIGAIAGFVGEKQ